MWQGVAVAGLVAACSLYVLWSLLLPGAARARLTVLALRLPLPAPLKRALQKRAALLDANACGCNGCDKAPKKAGTASAGQPIHIVRHDRR
jgi:hypothetical protein